MIINGRFIAATPTSFNWRSPEIVMRAVSGEPVLSPYWECTVGFSTLARPVYALLLSLIGQAVEVELPHPVTGEQQLFGCYLDSVELRYDRFLGVEGVDITFSGITVELPEYE